MAMPAFLLHAGGHDLGLANLAHAIALYLSDIGFPASYGIFQEYYSANDFAGSSNIAVVGACAMVRHLLVSPDEVADISTRASCIWTSQSGMSC